MYSLICYTMVGPLLPPLFRRNKSTFQCPYKDIANPTNTGMHFTAWCDPPNDQFENQLDSKSPTIPPTCRISYGNAGLANSQYQYQVNKKFGEIPFSVKQI